ncbi:MAG: DUF3800 domain-containing protein [Bacteroidales bacterium]|nr:DUF3800 domain-containing protein [Clostridium sp.]MCM1203130.1 DUF3800 domain-containing protein [Bacteroidales bacterium]
MKTYIAYFDKTGDDGVTMASSDHFVLTSLYMPAESWQQNFNLMRGLRKELRDKYGFVNQPITNMVEDIMEKNSSESYFIQICDFVSFFIHLYFKVEYRDEVLPNRVANVIDDAFVRRVLVTLKNSGRLNLKANETNQYGLVIYPK